MSVGFVGIDPKGYIDFHYDPTAIRVVAQERQMTEQYTWLRERVGEAGECWQYDLFTNTYYFRDSGIAMLFKLKWA